MNSFTITVDNCLDCKHHTTGGYVDATLGIYIQCNMKTADDLHGYKVIADHCHPATTRAQCSVPDWCPMLNKELR